MQPFITHSGLVVTLNRDNVDTDAIMPKQFMKSIARTGFGHYVFDEWRFSDAGYYGKPSSLREPRPEFVLNQPRFSGATILVTGRNFGCGSSREHAPWALQQFGFRVIIAKSFADIFANNCAKIGLLPIVLSEEEVNQITEDIAGSPGYRATINLQEQTVKKSDGCTFSFIFDSGQKAKFLEGTDQIGATLLQKDQIREFERTHLAKNPWL